MSRLDDRRIAPSDTTDATAATGAHVVSPALMVWITRTGLAVPRLDAPPVLHFSAGHQHAEDAARTIPLDRAGVELVEALGRAAPDAEAGTGLDVGSVVEEVASRLEMDRVGLDDLVRQLVSAGLLLPAPPSAATPPTLPVQPQRVPPGENQPAADVDAPGGDRWICAVPVALPATGQGLARMTHEGETLAHLTAEDVWLASAFVGGRTIDEVLDAVATSGGGGLGRDRVEQAVDRLRAAGLLAPHRVESQEVLRQALSRKFEAFARSDTALLEVVEGEARRASDGGTAHPIVVPVDAYEIPMLSLGMVVAYAQQHDGGALVERYAFAPLWYTRQDRFRSVLEAFGDHPAVFLFSHYTWTEHENLALSALVKEVLPRAVTVHGGPNVPKYAEDSAEWFARHPHVDVAVHGEGEITLAELLEALGPQWRDDGSADLSALDEVPGLTYRHAGGVHRTADRERLEDLDVLPSPYLGGLFENRERWGWPAVNLETNRGCPYGCTFCDWGSATLSRIRKFDLDRVKAEMEWAAQRGFEVFSLTDANFGILERDLEIAEWAVELHRTYGYPTAFQVNYAKNRVGNLAQIVQVLGDAGILTEGLVAVQTFDPGVLKTIRRSNIKQDRYDALTSEFRGVGLPLYTDVMVGLPGATVSTVRNDFQAAIDRELHVKSHPTQLLVNSPMNDPAYRTEHGIIARPGEHLDRAASYSHEEWIEMMRMRRFFYFAERRGLLRQVAVYCRSETGMSETDYYDRVRAAGEDSGRWPWIAYAVNVAPDEYVPPGSWLGLVEEVGRFCVAELGIEDDDALQTVLTVQHSLLPARGRHFPTELDLPHDYARWHDEVVAAKLEHTDGTWPEHVVPLRRFGPGRFVVEDRDDCCSRVIGQNAQGALGEVIWELDSPVTRAKQLR